MLVKIGYGKKELEVDIDWGERKRLSITVHPDLRITAKAPEDCSIESILPRLKKRASWISKQLDYFEQFQPVQPEKRYVSGETFYYLGRQYRLRISKAKRATVKLKGRFFEMGLPDNKDTEKAYKLMSKWYSDHARELLGARLQQKLPLFKTLGIQEPNLCFRKMKKRWGSCKKDGTILLNSELVKAPLFSIDYVIVHELCHLLYPHHNAKFYHLLQRILPDWESRKNRLEKVPIGGIEDSFPKIKNNRTNI